jgi:hypothetical protein
MAFSGETDSEAGSGVVGKNTKRVTIATDDAVFATLAAGGTAATTINRSTVNSAATSGTIIAANTARRGLFMQNTDANDLLLKYGATATATDFDHRVPAGGEWEMPSPVYTGIIDGIWTANGSGLVRVTESV